MVRLADRFVLENELGSGGMARVFLGRDEVLDRPVAVKVLNPRHGDTDIGDRFEREGRTAARLAHPNVVQVYDAGEGESDGRETSYIVMEYVPGGDLKELIDERGRLTGEELLRLGEEICAGLAHAHERGVIHRDIKPHNILLDENGHAKVTDFGIARALDATHATRTGSYLGTALYSSPEQLKGEKVTPKSDVYSLGVTLYQAAVGEPPFSGGTPIEVASQHVSKTPTPPRERGADVSEDLEALILACLAKNPDDRPTAEEARSRLGAAIPATGATQTQAAVPVAAPGAAAPRAEQTRTSPPAPPPGDRAGGATSGGRPARRGGLLAVLALLAVLVVIGALAAPSLLGGSGDESAGQNNARQNNAQQNNAQGGGNAGQSDGQPNGGSGGDQGSQGSGGNQQQGAASSAGSEQSASSQDSSGEQQNNPEQSGQQGGLTAQAAEQTIKDFYNTAAGPNYKSTWDFLTPRYQQEIGAQGRMTNQFQTLESVEFTSGPTATVNGNTATVSFSTIAQHTDHVDRPTLTATLVKEGGEWKIDSL